MIRFLKAKLIDYLAKDLFKFIDEKDLLRIEKGKVFYQDKALGNDAIKLLKGEASSFEKSMIWELLVGNSKYIANKRLFENVPEAKLLMLLINYQEKVLRQIAALKYLG